MKSLNPERSPAEAGRFHSQRWLWQPWLYVALGLHAAALFAPWPPQAEDAAPEPEEETVKITVLETPEAAPVASPAASPTPAASEAVAGAIAPPETFRTATLAPRTAPTPAPADSSAGSQPGRTANPRPGRSTVQDFFSAFPRYPNAQPGSAGILRPQFEQAAYLFHTGDGLEAIASYFQQALPERGFAWQPQLAEDNFQTYCVERDTGEVAYLHLIRQDDQTALFLNLQAYTLAQLYEAPTQPMAGTIRSDALLVLGMTLRNAGEFTFGRNKLRDRESELIGKMANPAPFLANGHLDAQRFELQGTVRGRTASEVSADLAQAFASGSYEVQPIGDYGGGELYKIQQADAHIYFIVAPAADEVVIISTDSDPRAS